MTFMWLQMSLLVLALCICEPIIAQTPVAEPDAVSENLLVKVATISLLGAKKTRPWIVLRELTFQKGDTLSLAQLTKEVAQSQKNIYNLGLFNQVVVQPLVAGQEVHIILRLTERWYLLGGPIFRIQERNNYDALRALFRGELRRSVVGLNLQWRNLTGRNETLAFSGHLGFTQKLFVSFSTPALFRKQNLELLLAGQYLREKEVILGTEGAEVRWGRVETDPLQRSFRFDVGLRKRFSQYENLDVRIGYQQYRFADSLYDFRLNDQPLRLITQPDGREQYPTLLLTYANDHRDIRSFPLSGYKYQLLFRAAGPRGGAATTAFMKIGGTWSQHIALNERWNVAYGFHLVYTLGDSIPFWEKSFIGINRRGFPGISTEMRGYEPFAIDGTFVNMNKAEVKYALFPRRIIHIKQIPFRQFQDMPFGLYLSAFCDTGRVQDSSFSNQDLHLKNRWLIGYGMGLNLIGFYDMLARIELSRNHLGQSGVYVNATVPIK